MKVIVASYSKTGTKSMNAALTELGYNVYDNVEHFWFVYEDWAKIFAGNGSIADFKRMYNNVDAVTDHPANVYWREIHEAFPEAKIILTIRDEENWYKSLVSQFDVASKDHRKFLSGITSCFLPLIQKIYIFSEAFALDVTGRPMKRELFAYRTVPDPLISKQRYRKHNAFVLQEAPKHKLLVFDVKEGWEPLCKFLEKDIPDKPFPWRNIGGKEYLSKHYRNKIERQAYKEMLFALVLAVIFFCTLFFYSNDNYEWWQTFTMFLFGVLTWYFTFKS